MFIGHLLSEARRGPVRIAGEPALVIHPTTTCRNDHLEGC
jgi:hypothetical protein